MSMLNLERVSAEMLPGTHTSLLKERALAGYALDAAKNEEIVALDRSLKLVWHWVAKSQQLHNTVIGLQELYAKREAPSSRRMMHAHRVYEATFRTQSLNLLEDYDITQPDFLHYTCAQAESSGQYTKSAFIATTHFDINRAIQSLKNQGESNGALLAVLETFQFEEIQPKVKKLIKRLSEQSEDTYARAILLFLAGSENYQTIINYLPMPDKLIFAMRFLTEPDLDTLFNDQIYYAQQYNDLKPLIIAGFTPTGTSILQWYLNDSADIQTVSLLSILMNAQSPNPNTDLNEWVNLYKEELNKLELWQIRCKLDIKENELRPVNREKGRHIKCYFCSKSLAINELVNNSVTNRRVISQQPTKPFINNCPECMKLLPRCVICLMPYSSINPYFELSRSLRSSKAPAPRSKFEEWFSWCEKCHHGGHNGHLLEWFELSSECAAAGCNCNCSQLD